MVLRVSPAARGRSRPVVVGGTHVYMAGHSGVQPVFRACSGFGTSEDAGCVAVVPMYNPRKFLAQVEGSGGRRRLCDRVEPRQSDGPGRPRKAIRSCSSRTRRRSGLWRWRWMGRCRCKGRDSKQSRTIHHDLTNRRERLPNSSTRAPAAGASVAGGRARQRRPGKPLEEDAAPTHSCRSWCGCVLNPHSPRL